eukprot:COSAG04_NODE_5821_length_1484_cov_1.272924_1_plen_67_part_10
MRGLWALWSCVGGWRGGQYITSCITLWFHSGPGRHPSADGQINSSFAQQHQQGGQGTAVTGMPVTGG